MVDGRTAVAGVQRAYFNPPFTPGTLATSMNFPLIQHARLAVDSREWQHTHADAAAESGLPEAAVAALAV